MKWIKLEKNKKPQNILCQWCDPGFYPQTPSGLCCAVLSCVWLFATPWTVACQAPRSMEFSRQEYWSGLPYPSPGDLPNLGIKPGSPASPALVGRFFNTELSVKPCACQNLVVSFASNFIFQSRPSCEFQMHIQLPACFTLGANERSDSACSQSDCQDLP